MKKLLLSSLILSMSCALAHSACNYAYTVCPSGCDSNVLNTVVTTVETDCASPTSPITITISGTWSSADTTAVGISGITTDATNNLTIATTGDARHDGTWKNNTYLMYFSDGAAWFTVGYSIYLIIDGLRLEKNAYPSGSSSRYGINLATGVGTSGNLATIKNCILKDSTQWDSGTGAQTGIYVGDKDWNVLIYNNVFYNWKRTSSTNVCIATDYDSNPLNIYNNTFINSTKGIRIGGNPTITIKNNIFQDDTADVEGTIDTQATNLTDLTDVASGLTAGSNVFESALTFINKTGNNYHLSTSDTSAINAGSDLSGTFTTDIDGTTRSGTWDIGADEYVASAPAGLTSSVLGGGRFGGMKIHY